MHRKIKTTQRSSEVYIWTGKIRSANQSIDPLQVSQAIRQALPPEDQPEIRFGTGFFSKDASPLSPQEQRDVLNRLFSELLENGQMKREE